MKDSNNNTVTSCFVQSIRLHVFLPSKSLREEDTNPLNNTFLKSKLKRRFAFMLIIIRFREIFRSTLTNGSVIQLINAYLVFTKPKLIFDNGTVTVDLPNEIVRRVGRATRFFLKDRWICNFRQFDDLLGDS